MASKRKSAAVLEGPSARTRSTDPSPSPTKRPRTTITSALASSGGGRPSPSPATSRSVSQVPTPKKAAKGKAKYKYRNKKVPRSIWNSKDDWETLVSESSLSTSSISLRPPRLAASGTNDARIGSSVPTLARYCTRCIARHFKGLWEASAAERPESMGEDFKLAWRELPDKLKEPVRDEVFRWWGGYLTLRMIIDVFTVPPHMFLPGNLLPAIAMTDRLKEFIPSRPSSKETYTSLTLAHADKVTDTGVAGLLYHLPNLERVNMKGCLAVGGRTVKIMIDRCKRLRRVNLKGTGVGEEEVRLLLDAFGQQLEGLKVDRVAFENINTTFASGPYPRMTHLCLPGSLLNPAHGMAESRARLLASSIGYPEPRPTPSSSLLQWEILSQSFPALSHLYLPDLLVVEGTKIDVPPGLVEFTVLTSSGTSGGLGSLVGTGSSGAMGGGPPIPIETITNLLEPHTATLRAIHLGHLRPSTRGTSITSASVSNPRSSAFYTNAESEFARLGAVLAKCEKLESFSWVNKVGGSLDTGCDLATASFADLVYEPGLVGSWRRSLKHLTLVVPQAILAHAFDRIPWDDTPQASVSRLPISDAEQAAGPGSDTEIRSDGLQGALLTDREVTSIRTDSSTHTHIHTPRRSPLETLNIPSANIDDTAHFARAISASFNGLRVMDLSGTKITDDDMRTIVGSCPLLHRIDLTSCRGVNVRHRRNIFKAFKDDR